MRSRRSAGAIAAAVLCGGLLLTGCNDKPGGGAGAGTPSAPGSASAPGSTAGSSATPSAGSPSGAPTDRTPPTPPPPSSDPAPSASVPANAPRLVAATVSGGIDGRHRSVLVNDDGSYTVLDRKKPPQTGRMTPAELAELRAALRDSDFAKLPRVSVASPPIADGIATAVIHQGHEVVTDGMKKVPKLDRVIAALPGLG
ncbi:hypothetical protein [Streptomyces sp. NPDC054863]